MDCLEKFDYRCEGYSVEAQPFVAGTGIDALSYNLEREPKALECYIQACVSESWHFKGQH